MTSDRGENGIASDPAVELNPKTGPSWPSVLATDAPPVDAPPADAPPADASPTDVQVTDQVTDGERAQPTEDDTAGPSASSEVAPSPPGDAAPSWDEIAERYGDTVFTMAYRLTGDRDEARDLAQDVFVRVYRNLHRYRPGTFEGWLFRITKNLFLDRLRRRQRLRWEPLPDEEWRQPAEVGPGPAERVEEGMLGGDLEEALLRLAPSFRVAVVMCDVQGLSYEEIAVATGWPIGTVRSRIHRGRRMLRRELGGGSHG